MNSGNGFGYFQSAVFLVLVGMAAQALGQSAEPLLSLAKKEKPALIETLRELVSIESGSRDHEGLDKLARFIAGRLKGLGGQVELVEPSDVYKMEDTPERIGKMVRATFAGTDAAFTALRTKAPVIERFGLQGYGAHSADAEYVLLDSIEPRLYLLARMISDVSQGKKP